MEREEAIKRIKERIAKEAWCTDDEDKDALTTLIPELAESEDERMRKELIEFLDEVWHLGRNTNFDRWGKEDCANWIAYLEKKKEQKPAEWSKEDEEIWQDIFVLCNKFGYDDACRLLKSSLRPQHHWKPSDEQMNALKNCVYGDYQNGDGPALRELYDYLKKL